MSAELAVLTQINNKPTNPTVILVDTADKAISKYASIYIDQNGKATDAFYNFTPSNIEEYTQFPLVFPYKLGDSTSVAPLNSQSAQGALDLGNGYFMKLLLCVSSTATVYFQKLVIYKIDTINKTVSIVSQTSGMYFSSSSLSETAGVDNNNYGTVSSFCLVGSTVVVCVTGQNATTYGYRVFEVPYNATSKILGVPVNKFGESGTSGNMTQAVVCNPNNSSTHYFGTFRNSSNGRVGFKALGTTTSTTFASTDQISDWLGNLYSVGTAYWLGGTHDILKYDSVNSRFYGVYSSAIYSFAFTNTALTSVTSHVLNSISLDDNSPSITNGNIIASKIVGDKLYVAWTGVGYWIVSKIWIVGSTLYVEDSTSYVNDPFIYVILDTYLACRAYSVKTEVNDVTYFPLVHSYDRSQDTDSGSDYKTYVLETTFTGSTFTVPAITHVVNNSANIYSTAYPHFYIDVNGTFLFANATNDIDDASAFLRFSRLDKISDSFIGDLTYSKKTKAIALEDIPADSTGRVLIDSYVLTDDTATAGSILLDKYITTNKKQLLEVL